MLGSCVYGNFKPCQIMKYQSQLWNVFKNYQPFRVKKMFVWSFNREMYLLFNAYYCLPCFFFFSCYIAIGVWGD